MARPDCLADIEPREHTDFGTIRVDDIVAHPAMLKAYATFVEAIQKAGGSVSGSSYSMTLSRSATIEEQLQDLRSAQSAWDMRQREYESMKDFGEIEDWKRDSVRAWAEAEGLPFPPEHEPIESFDATIRDIDEVLENA